MSRIIVKDLPKNISEERIRNIFSEKGIITDVQLKYTKQGKFRRFCFIGYKYENDAQAAVEYFNKSCIDTSKISVSLSAELGDPTKPKSWSKYSADSNVNNDKKSKSKEENTEEVQEKVSKEKKKKKKDKSKNNDSVVDSKVKEALKKHKDDPLFQEFLETKTKHGELKSVWSNDMLLSVDTKEFENSESEDECSDNEKKEDKETVNIAKSAISDLEYMQMLKNKSVPDSEEKKSVVVEKKKDHGSNKFFTVKIKGLSKEHKKKNIKQFFKPLKAKSIRVARNGIGIAYVGFKLERHMKQALNKHKSFLDGKQVSIVKYIGKDDDNKTEDLDESKKIKWKKQEESLKDEESIAESGCIFFRNLTYSTTEDNIKNLFEKYGPITEISFPIDKDTRKFKGFGTITFLMPEHAVKAYNALDGTSFEGRLLHLLPAKSKASDANLLQQEGLSHKEKKTLMQKAAAASSHNWNTLFLGQNAVVDAISAAYNKDKEEVLKDTSQGPSVAVRLALGETQLVEKTRKFLEENGVRLNAFNQPSVKRSKTVIIAKNLPKETKVKEIRDLFAKFGELARVVMPPFGITALIEFTESSEARKALKKLAYTRFKYLPLYLEWAPEDTFINEAKPVQNTKPNINDDVKTEEEEKENNNEEDDEDDEPEPDTTLFVKNLNFSTPEEQLKKYFEKCGKVHYASIAMKKDTKNPGQKLSMGYGFIRYKLKMDTDKALKELQMTTFDGKTLELKRSERTLQTDIKTTRRTTKITPQTGTRILVRNIPFQATTKEVEEIFKVYGQLKGVRLPKKMVGTEKHRGFGFVEYFTKKDAKAAFKALCQSTHLYGRRLVLEWAQAEEDVEELRKRTAKHFHEEPASKRSKKSVVKSESMGITEEFE